MLVIILLNWQVLVRQDQGPADSEMGFLKLYIMFISCHARQKADLYSMHGRAWQPMLQAQQSYCLSVVHSAAAILVMTSHYLH